MAGGTREIPTINGRFKYLPILKACGRGSKVEEKCAWEGFWNEELVTSMTTTNDSERLTVLLTGRHSDFLELISSMLKSKGLTFDLVFLKPKVEGLRTLPFKLDILTEVLRDNPTIEEIEIYEDRKSHAQGFQNYFQERVSDSTASAKFKVHMVEMSHKYLDKLLELRLVHDLIAGSGSGVVPRAF